MYIIKKYPVNIYFTYADGDDSQHIVADKIMLEDLDSFPRLVLDLSSNLRVLNKEMSCYKETDDIKNENVEIVGFRIESDSFLRKFEYEYEKVYGKRLILELRFAKNKFSYYKISIDDIEKHTCYFRINGKFNFEDV